MLEKAKSDIERLNACNTLWTLAFDEDNRQEIKNNDSALLELRKLLLTKNSELKGAAGGALWETGNARAKKNTPRKNSCQLQLKKQKVEFFFKKLVYKLQTGDSGGGGRGVLPEPNLNNCFNI